MLSKLRDDELLKCSLRKVTIPDVAALQQMAVFDPQYLHIDDLDRGNGREDG